MGESTRSPKHSEALSVDVTTVNLTDSIFLAYTLDAGTNGTVGDVA
jgi:hypothetical protein